MSPSLRRAHPRRARGADARGVERLDRPVQPVARAGLRLDRRAERAQRLDLLPHRGARHAEALRQFAARDAVRRGQLAEQQRCVDAHAQPAAAAVRMPYPPSPFASGRV